MPAPIPAKKPILPPSKDTLEKADLKSHVRVFNKTSRTFLHHGFRASPNTFATVPPELAEFWMDRYPDLIVGSETAARELGGANARVAEIQGRLDDANKKIALLEATPRSARQQQAEDALNAKVSKLEGDNASLVKQVEDLNAQLEQLTKPGADSV